MSANIPLLVPDMSGTEADAMHQVIIDGEVRTSGNCVNTFEEVFSQYTGNNAAVAVSSGTCALELAIRTLDIGYKDVVFCSTFTFIASANPIAHVGATPVFIDCDPLTWQMDPNALEMALLEHAKIGKLPKAVVVVHMYGYVSPMSAILVLCEKYSVPIIEDAAEALGATFQDHPCGSDGTMAAFSFHWNKLITTSSGGMLCAKNPAFIKKAKHLATQAPERQPYYWHLYSGFNYRMSNILACMGVEQMKDISRRIQRKQYIGQYYKSKLLQMESMFEFPEKVPSSEPIHWMNVCKVNIKKTDIDIETLREKLNLAGIESRRVVVPLHQQPCFRSALFFPYDNWKIASQEIFETSLCLPSSTNLTNNQLDYITNSISDILRCYV